MKATVISGHAPGGERTRLAEVLPLSTPYVVQIFPVYACNFRCNYCIFSLPESQRPFISDKIKMEFDLFQDCVDSFRSFPDKIKVLRFVGIGEPLLHSELPRMIEYADNARVAEKTELLTNASRLRSREADALIAAGLSRLVVSIQGTSAARYYSTCRVRIDFRELLENLHYFYRQKEKTHVYIKIVDTALADADDEQRFYELFGNCCDTIAVEHTVPIHKGIDFDRLFSHRDCLTTQFGLPVNSIQVCPQPFFTMQINPDGKVVPCYSFEYPEIIGDCNVQSAHAIWQSTKFQVFRCRMLAKGKQANRVCRECKIIDYRQFPEDDLSQDAERLKRYFCDG